MNSIEVGWNERSADLLLQNLALPLAQMERGQGCYLWDSSGTQYLDFLGGIAVNSLGHCHPEFVSTLNAQAQRLDHISNYFVSRPQLDLAEKLLDISGAAGGRVFFSNSGTEANEAAFKLVRLHGKGKGKTRVLAFEGAFHGRTMGALALTAKEDYRTPFEPLAGGVEHIPLSVEALEAAMGDDVAAIFLEPIQGEAGVRELPEGLLRRARELTTEHDALLVLDEVQTGIGRVGSWFAFQQEGITPDAVTLAKGMGAGFPIGALIAFKSCADLFYPGSHGTTFGGNPLAAAVSLRVLEVIEEQAIIENVSVQEQRLREGIADLGSPLVAGVRGSGLLLGVVLRKPIAVQVAKEAFSRGLIINAPSPEVIRLAPPLIVGQKQVEEFLALFGQALESASA